MKCQIVKVTGKLCRASAEGIVVPEDGTAEDIYKQKLWVCPRHGRHLLKQTDGSRWVTLADIETQLADRGEELPVPQPLGADEISPTEEAIVPAAILPAEAPARTLLYTTAPEDYDGFDAQTERILGTYKHGAGHRTYRLVSIPDEHAEWYRNRCGSGLHNTHLEDEWAEITAQPFFRAKFTAAEGYVLPEPVAPPPIPIRPVLPKGDIQSLVTAHLSAPATESPRPMTTVSVVPEVAPPVLSPTCAQHKGRAEELRQEKSNLTAQIKALQAQAKALAEQAKREEQAAKKQAALDAALRKQRLPQLRIVTPRGIDAYPELRQALIDGGSTALDIFAQYVAAGTILLRRGKGMSAPKTPKAPRETAPKTSGRQLTQAEIDDILRRHADGEKAVDIGKVHGLHHVTVNAVIQGRIKSKTA